METASGRPLLIYTDKTVRLIHERSHEKIQYCFDTIEITFLFCSNFMVFGEDIFARFIFNFNIPGATAEIVGLFDCRWLLKRVRLNGTEGIRDALTPESLPKGHAHKLVPRLVLHITTTKTGA